jgi:hypothetical protein
MAYRNPRTFARKDLLTPGDYNQLIYNARELETALRAEHTVDGEHNVPHIARSVGQVRYSGGYSLVGFGGDVSLGAGHNPVVGRLRLTMAADRYAKNAAPVLVQNTSATGITWPCLTMVRWVDDVTVETLSVYWHTDGFVPDGIWEATVYGGSEDATFNLAVHGPLLATGAIMDFGAPLLTRQGLRAATGSTYVNQLIQGSADLEAALQAAHATGAHDVRGIPKAWAHVQWTGSRYVILDQACSASFDGSSISSVEVVGDGVAEVVFASPMSTGFYQTFVDVDYPRAYSTTAGFPLLTTNNYFIACVPETYSLQQSTRIYFYMRYYDTGIEKWVGANGTDFHLWIYDDHGANP